VAQFIPTAAEITYLGGKSYSIGRFTFRKNVALACDDSRVITYCMKNSLFTVAVRKRRPIVAPGPPPKVVDQDVPAAGKKAAPSRLTRRTSTTKPAPKAVLPKSIRRK